MKPSSIQAFAIRTPLFKAGQEITRFIIENVTRDELKEKSILAVTSKIVSLAEGRVVLKNDVPSKMDLVKREADLVLANSSYGTALTVKHGILIPAAGIDESNAEGDEYILFPEDPIQSARQIYNSLKSHYQLNELGVIITDSHTHPLRRGVTGIGLAHWGFYPTRKLVGQKDLFGRPLQMTYVNVLDALSVAAVYVMGESNESCPLAIVNSTGVEFCDQPTSEDIKIPIETDLYGPLLERR